MHLGESQHRWHSDDAKVVRTQARSRRQEVLNRTVYTSVAHMLMLCCPRETREYEGSTGDFE